MNWYLQAYLSIHKSSLALIPFFSPADDFRQLNDKLVEVNSSKMALQMKLDQLEAAEVNIKVNYIIMLSLLIISKYRNCLEGRVCQY